jgi:hypothetical protein
MREIRQRGDLRFASRCVIDRSETFEESVMQAENEQARKGSRTFLRYSRYILVIDGQRKSSFGDASSAQAEADKIQAAYPRLNVVIHDQEKMRDITGQAEAETPVAPTDLG